MKDLRSILFCIVIILLMSLITIAVTSRTEETITYEVHLITMKWMEAPDWFGYNYFFEFDNTTEYEATSYEYHKYNVGDIYTLKKIEYETYLFWQGD